MALKGRALQALLAVTALGFCSGGNILMYMGQASKSHWHTRQPLARALADRGHNMTLFIPFEDKKLAAHPNVELVNMDTPLHRNEDGKSKRIFNGDPDDSPTKFLEMSIDVRLKFLPILNQIANQLRLLISEPAQGICK